jgi:two-component system cell cycle sensor histidine kinase/response regulator CckA
MAEPEHDLAPPPAAEPLAARLAAAERARHEAEEQYRLLVEGSRDVISRIDLTGRVTYVSPAVHDVLGYRPEELVGRQGLDFIETDEVDARRTAMARGASEGVAPPVTCRHRRKDGSHVWIEYHSSVLRDADGRVTGFQSIGRDVTARREAEEAFRRSQDAFVAFIETIPDPIVLHREGKAVFVNRGFLTLVGYDRADELLGRSVIELVHPDDRAYIGERLATPHAERAGNITIEHRLVRRDGSEVPVEVVTVPIVFEGQVTPLAFVHDLRERKRLEAQLVLADRMASLGRLSASVGHEINNPLAYALGALELLGREVAELGPHEPARAARLASLLAIARDGAERVRTIVGDMRVLSRGGADERGPVDVVRVLDQCAAMAAHEIRHRARLVKRYQPVPLAYGNEARLGQVFLNLLVNAAEAIGEGDVDDNEVTVEVRPSDEGAVVVEIRDTGAGIAPEIVDRIFEPFFSTKGAQGGTGLGLSISHHIVTGLGGTISVEPNRPRGACFRVTLRPSAETPRATRATGAPPAADFTAGRVLVVDDEPLLVKVIAGALQGHEVTSATSGREALDLVRSGAAFDVIVCDLHMAGMSGIDLYEHVLREFPALARRMVFMTGGAVSERARGFVESSGCRILDKPFSRARIAAAVRDVLTRPRA